MAGMNTLQIIKTIPKLVGENFIEWIRSLNGILHIAWPFSRKVINGLERPGPILSGSKEGEINTVVIRTTRILILVM